MFIAKAGKILVFIISFFNFSICNEEEPLVNLPLGKVRGSVLKTYNGKKFSAFRGIPYAKPPIEELRFKPPEKLTDPWPLQTFDATNEGPSCLQFDPLQKRVFGQEDCLVLNVYTSKFTIATKKITKKPVMVFIYGGGFNYGTSNSSCYGPKKLLDYDIVLVSFNYRLSLYGFLSTQDEVSPGNYGLLDQVLALKWVQENIEAFGGDPNKVTIFGQSAGGSSVNYHLISELSTGLFKSAIVMSGTPLAFWAFDNEPMHITKKFASALNCSTTNSKEITECLRQRSSDEIAKLLPEYGTKLMSPFRPVVDGYFLKEHPLTLYKSGRIVNRVPLIYGHAQNEGIFFYGVFYQNSLKNLSDQIIKEIIAHTYEIYDPNSVQNSAIKLVKNQYFQYVNSTDSEAVTKKLIQLIGDGIIYAPLYWNLKFYLKSEINPFVYSFDYNNIPSIAKLFKIENSAPTHMDDLYFMFDSKLLFNSFDIANDKQEDQFLKLAVNFANTSNPTPENFENFIKWLPAKNNKIKVYHLDNPITLKKFEIDEKMVDFWMKTLPKNMKLNIKI